MDPLSDVLSLLKPRSYMSAGIDAGAPWAIQFPDQGRAIKTGAVVKGDCWLVLDGADAVHLNTGDCILLPQGRPFFLGSSPSTEPLDAPTALANNRFGYIRTVNGGGDCLFLSSRFALEGSQAEALLGMLPPLVHIRDQNGAASLSQLIARTMEEMRNNEPGTTLVLQHLAHMMLIQALRLYRDDHADSVGWFAALTDRQLGQAIQAIHDNPARPWTVEALARHAGMSRSAFAARFREMVGQSPIAYVTRWRMLLAGDRLTGSHDPVSVIALELGYESESAFSTAFKRMMGCSPRRYSREVTAGAAGSEG
ncbi:AraC family transcriptional regulator [Marinobacter sp. R17]|uniref:AraC family transcriptional regulator n=1 Tax=Marinobacter sp. R17 TaxID=2484250 RepID=UPI000F4BC502|nr:AraC family transcriptional regulator [Marinobacter sp. R17]ROU00693.1 AraC family transcriptional regulator [Marinobacter sp. R17]